MPLGDLSPAVATPVPVANPPTKTNETESERRKRLGMPHILRKCPTVDCPNYNVERWYKTTQAKAKCELCRDAERKRKKRQKT